MKLAKKISFLIFAIFAANFLAGCSLKDVLNIPSDQTSITPDTISNSLLNVIKWAGEAIGVVAVIMLIYGGIMYITSMGNEQNMEKAKNTVMWAIIAIVVVSLAGLFVGFILNIFGVKS